MKSIHSSITLVVALLNLLVNASTVTYDFNITWVLASPDGFIRPVIGINHAWPNPTISANLGDTIVVNVHNQLGNQSTSLHFHGLFMKKTNHMDGTSGIVQCAILPDGKFKYEFRAEQVGTYWYHSHMQSQYPDGLRGALIIQDPKSPFSDKYDDEILLTMSDWYHKQMPDLMPIYEDPKAHMLPDPKPDAYLLNDTQNLKVTVEPGKTYLMRLINIGALKPQRFWIDEHVMTVVEIDGLYTKPTNTDSILLAPGQRCAFLVKMKASTGLNFAIGTAVDKSADRTMMSHSTIDVVDTTPVVASGWLVYGASLELAPTVSPTAGLPINDTSLRPYDDMELLESPNITINLVVDMKRLEDGIDHWMFNSSAYVQPKVPTLFSAMTDMAYAGDDQPFILPSDRVVELIIYNKHMTGHPFHLHGHAFQVANHSPRSGGRYNATTMPLTEFPIRRDTVVVPGGGNAVLRFRTDNPGVWFFHCHMEWHAHSGLALTFVEGPDTLQSQKELSLSQKLTLTNLRECVPAELLPPEIQHEEEADTTRPSTSSFASHIPALVAALLTISTMAVAAVYVIRGFQTGQWWPQKMGFSNGEQQYQLVGMVDEDLRSKEEDHPSINDKLESQS